MSTAKFDVRGMALFFAFLAPVVRKVDNAIHQINHYPLDSAIGFAYPVIHWIVVYPADNTYYLLFEQLTPVSKEILLCKSVCDVKSRLDPCLSQHGHGSDSKLLGPVVQTMDSAIRRINH